MIPYALFQETVIGLYDSSAGLSRPSESLTSGVGTPGSGLGGPKGVPLGVQNGGWGVRAMKLNNNLWLPQ